MDNFRSAGSRPASARIVVSKPDVPTAGDATSIDAGAPLRSATIDLRRVGRSSVRERHTTADLLALLRHAHLRSESNASQIAIKAKLPRSTVYNFVSTKYTRLPRKREQIIRFLQACKCDDAEIRDILQLWARLNSERHNVSAPDDSGHPGIPTNSSRAMDFELLVSRACWFFGILDEGERIGRFPRDLNYIAAGSMGGLALIILLVLYVVPSVEPVGSASNSADDRSQLTTTFANPSAPSPSATRPSGVPASKGRSAQVAAPAHSEPGWYNLYDYRPSSTPVVVRDRAVWSLFVGSGWLVRGVGGGGASWTS